MTEDITLHLLQDIIIQDTLKYLLFNKWGT